MASQNVESQMPVAPMWSPSPERVARANLTAFMRFVRDRGQLKFHGYTELLPLVD